MSEAIEHTQTEPTELYQKKLQELLEKGKATKKLPSRLLIETLDLLDADAPAMLRHRPVSAREAYALSDKLIRMNYFADPCSKR